MKKIFTEDPIAGVLIVIGILLVIALIIAGICIAQENSNDAATHQVGKYSCPACGSRDTSGHTTYWTNDGMYVKHKDLADYTLFRCNYCNHSLKVKV
jgi:DNA-directed RNA polymerase subunit RPC12/RpoP